LYRAPEHATLLTSLLAKRSRPVKDRDRTHPVLPDTTPGTSSSDP